ncbi:MAG: phosphotransferase family protein [Halioglobus sp.]|nr:phosphotransferase family protein [Halioglobus sp.]
MAKHDLGDMEQIRSKLEGWLRINLADAENLKLGDLKFPEESGESSVTLIMKAQNNGAELGLICRMVPPQSAVFAEHDLRLQYKMMKIAGDNGVPVPPLLGMEEDASLLGSEFYIMGLVDGQVPTDNPPYAFGSWVTELSDGERSTMWKNGVATLAKIHQINLDDYDVRGVPVSPEGQSPVQHEIDKFNAMFSDEIRDRMPPVVAQAMQYINENAPASGVKRLCWGDSRPGNIIWKDLAPVAVIDWEMASISDPMLDVSWWYWIDYCLSVGLGLQRLGGLPSREDIYAQWHAITGLPLEHADYYDLFNITRFAVILEKKYVAMGATTPEPGANFVVPFVEQQLKTILAG